MATRNAARNLHPLGWLICFTLVFLSEFFLSGAQAPPLDLDPSWHAALEYAATHHFQFGTQIVFTFGPLGFLSARTGLGHLVGARIAFALLWGALVAIVATAITRRLHGWVRYAFLAWFLIFTTSEGLDQTAFFVMAASGLLLLAGSELAWQAPLIVAGFLVLSLIKFSFLTAAAATLAVVLAGWIVSRRYLPALWLIVGTPAGFIALWIATGQSPANVMPWLSHVF